MIAWIIGLLIFGVALIGFLVSIIICAVKREYSIAPIVWCIVLNIGNVVVQISRIFIK